MVLGIFIGIFIGCMLFSSKSHNNSTVEYCKSPTYERPKRLNR